VTTERILSKEQTAETGYLRRVRGVTLRDKDHRSEIRKTRDVKPLSESRDPSCVSSAMCLEQEFPNWGTCTPRGTFAYPKGYI